MFVLPIIFPENIIVFTLMFVSINSNTTGATSGAGTVFPSGTPELSPPISRARVVQSYIFFVVKIVEKLLTGR